MYIYICICIFRYTCIYAYIYTYIFVYVYINVCHQSIEIDVRLYNHLFTVEEPSDIGWERELNHASLPPTPFTFTPLSS
jgi:hypothetical protein